MKAQILKIAGVKNEKEFYKKFPTEAAFMKKHGKELNKLKKADGGTSVPADALDYMSNGSMPSDYQGTDLSNIGQSAFGGIDKFINSDFGGTTSPSSKKGFDWKGLAGKTAPVLGSLIGNIQQIGQENKDIANAKKYAQISDLTLQAASSRPEQVKRRYVRPEDMLTQTVNPLGVGTNYLAAENGAEIANYYSSPDTIYTDGGFEPLNDSNVKQYKKGGKLKKADGGLNLDPFAGVAGGLGGALGSATGKGTGKGGAASSIGSTIGGIAGSFLPIPGVGTALGSLVGGFAGGLFDAGRQNELQEAEDKLNKNLQASAFQSGAQNIQSQNKGFMEEGGWVSHDWQPQVIATFGEHKLKDLLKPPHDADMLRAGGHLKYYTPPTERAMYTGKAEYGSQMAFGGDVQVGNGYIKPLSNDVHKLIGPSHEDGGMPFANGHNVIEAEGDETFMKTYADGGSVDDESITIFGNRFINKDAAEFAGVKPGKKYKKQSEELALDQTKFENKATKNFASADDMEVDDMFSQIEQRTKLLNGEAFTKKADNTKNTLKKLAAYQNETDDIARSQGLEINAFDKGIMKPIKESDMAKFGAKLETAREGSHIKKFKEFEETVNASLKKMYPGRNAYVKPATGGVYNQVGGRDISSQAGIFKKGHSQTPISAHNYNAARDYRIYIDGMEVSPQGNEDMYADILWPVATKLGMYNVGDRDPSTPDKNWDPAHIGLAKEGKGTLYNELSEKYPDIFEDPNAKKTIDWIAKNKNADTTIAKHFRLINEAGIGKGVLKNVIDNVGNAISEVSPMGKIKKAATEAISGILDKTSEGLENIVDWWNQDDQLTPSQITNKVRPKGQARDYVRQPAPAAPNAAAPADSWADDGSKYWKPILGVPTEFSSADPTPAPQTDGWDRTSPMQPGVPTKFPNQKTRTGLLGKDYDPGYNEQPFWKPRNLEYTPSEPLTETRTVIESGNKSNAVQQAIANAKGKGKAVGATAPAPNGMGRLQAQGTPTGKYDWNNQLTNLQTAAGEPTFVDPRNAGWSGTDEYQQISNPVTAAATASGQTVSATDDKNKWWKEQLLNAFGSVAPYLRPSNARALDPAQLAGEMYALGNNQVAPVQAQLYSPMLQAQPYSISLQDQLNEVTAQTRSAERLAQGNPAALSMIAAQGEQAKSKILGEQFRMNQGEQVRAAEANRAQWNDAQLKNLGILDQQYARQEEAKSKTKAQTMEALKSMAAKQAQNKLENRTLGIKENLYNYRFGPDGQAYSLNAPYNFNIPDVGYGAGSVNEIGGGRSAKELRALADLQEEAASKKTKATPARNGAIVKAIKNL